MKLFTFIFFLLSSTVFAAEEIGNLKASEQPYFKNDNMDGHNKLERIDNNVRAINKLYGEIAAMKTEIQKLKAEVAELKAKR